jgi:hypothetical protein
LNIAGIGCSHLFGGVGKVSGQLQCLQGSETRHQESSERAQLFYSAFRIFQIPAILGNGAV